MALAESRSAKVGASRHMAAARVAVPPAERSARLLEARAPRRLTLEPRDLTARAVVAERPIARLPITACRCGTARPRPGQPGDPVAGAVVGRFGEGQKPPFDRGLTIEVEDRRLVRAPRDGRVVFARGYDGFGLLLIIDHGDEYHSLLSGLSRFVVHEGWAVRAGQMVGTIEPGKDAVGRLYVELRRSGIPVDPLTWFAAGQDKVRS